MQQIFSDLTSQLGAYLPSLLGALAIILVGWVASLAVAALVRSALVKLRVDARLTSALDEEPRTPPPIATWISRVVFYLLMIFVVVAAFQTLQLDAVTGPLEQMLAGVTAFLPQLVGAAVLLLLAWVIGAVLRAIITKALARTSLDETVAKEAGMDEQRPLSKTLGDIAFWLPLLLLFPAVLGVLKLDGLMAPLQGMLDDLLAVLPDLLGAAVILLLGWLIAKIARRIVASLLAAVGVDRLGERVGMGPAAGPRRLSAVLGLVTYALILIPATVAALDALRLEAISRPAQTMLGDVMRAVPMIFGAAVILAVAYLIGRIVSSLVTGVLGGLGFDTLFTKLGLGSGGGTTQRSPSAIAGYLTLVAVMLLAAVEAANMLGLGALSLLVQEFFTFGSRLLLGLAIFGVGLYLGNLAYEAIPRGPGKATALYASAARIAIVVLATAMALQQTGVAEEIVTLAFGLVLGAIAVAAAIAFGLGSRDAAAGLVNRWMERQGRGA